MLIYVIFVSSEQIHIDLQFALKNRDLILFSRIKNPFLVFLEIIIRLHLRRQPHLQLPILSHAEFLRNIDLYLLNFSSGLIDEYQPEFLLIFPRIILHKIIALVELLRIENIYELALSHFLPSGYFLHQITLASNKNLLSNFPPDTAKYKYFLALVIAT